eukprot:GHVR01147664.1.p1 GENE.GHVR01147664.1~~GHVR01147664.1.p1  ORF type:complete len:273 (-),score=75.56 GHVR01147664.1:23-814(-)
MSFSLAGKVAVITGASSGIGAEIARCLALKGIKVGLGARRLDLLEEVKGSIVSITNRHEDVFCMSVDVVNREQVHQFVTATEAALGPIHIAIINAGVMPYTYMKSCEEDQWERMVDVNCKGFLHLIGGVLPLMIDRKVGHIVVTSSDAGRKVFDGLAVYSGTKHFIEATCRGIRQEMASINIPIKVTLIQPGDVNTNLAHTTTDLQCKLKYCNNENDNKNKNKNEWEGILSSCDVAGGVVYALEAPPHLAINEILMEPTTAPI